MHLMKPIILFDGVCNLCNRSVQFVIRRDPKKKFQLASLQSESARTLLIGAGTDPTTLPDSIVLLEGDTVYVRSDAILHIGKALSFPWSAMATAVLWIPRGLRDSAYQWIARNRYRWFGKRNECMVPQEADLDRFLTDDTDTSAVNS